MKRHHEDAHSRKVGADFMGGMKQAGGPGSSGSTQKEHGHRGHKQNPGGYGACASCGDHGGAYKAGGKN